MPMIMRDSPQTQKPETAESRIKDHPTGRHGPNESLTNDQFYGIDELVPRDDSSMKKADARRTAAALRPLLALNLRLHARLDSVARMLS